MKDVRPTREEILSLTRDQVDARSFQSLVLDWCKANGDLRGTTDVDCVPLMDHLRSTYAEELAELQPLVDWVRAGGEVPTISRARIDSMPFAARHAAIVAASAVYASDTERCARFAHVHQAMVGSSTSREMMCDPWRKAR